MRTIIFDLSHDSNQTQYRFGGYEGEHNETRLCVILPQRLLPEGEAEYRLLFENARHVEIFSAPLEAVDGEVSLVLPQNLMLAPALKAQVGLFCYESGRPVLIAKSAQMILNIKNPLPEKSEKLSPAAPEAPGLVLEDAVLPGSANPVKSAALYEAFGHKIDRTELVTEAGGGIRERSRARDDLPVSEKATAAKLTEYWEKSELPIESSLSDASRNPVQNRTVKAALDAEGSARAALAARVSAAEESLSEAESEMELIRREQSELREAVEECEEYEARIDDLEEGLADLEADFNAYVSTVTSWGDVQKIVRLGRAAERFSIGDQFKCRRGNEELTWEVIGIDQETPADSRFTHSLTLQLLTDPGAPISFDGREALFSNEHAIPAGTYYFTVTESGGYASDVGESFQFTLAQEVAIGSQMVLQGSADHTLDGTAMKIFSGPTDLVGTSVTLTRGSAGHKLFDASNTPEELCVELPTEQIYLWVNAIRRAFFGSNCYRASFVRQYLASDEASVAWTAQTPLDRPIRAYLEAGMTPPSGFLYGMDEDFLAVLGDVKKKTAIPTADQILPLIPGLEQPYQETAERFFLLSRSELTGGTDDGEEGSVYEYYDGAGQAGRIRYRSDGVATNWWTRTRARAGAYQTRYVSTAGRPEVYAATDAMRVFPACCIV